MFAKINRGFHFYRYMYIFGVKGQCKEKIRYSNDLQRILEFWSSKKDELDFIEVVALYESSVFVADSDGEFLSVGDKYYVQVQDDILVGGYKNV